MFVRKSSKESTPILHRLVVEKHGSHNQSSHGKGGGKGGGGGSSATTESKSMSDAKEDLDNNISGAKKVLGGAKNANTANNARGTIKGFKDVKGALGDKKKMDKVRLKRNSLAAQVKNNPMSALDNRYAEDLGYINAATAGLSRYGDL